MASFRSAVDWIAHNDGAGETPAGMSWNEALSYVDGQVTVCLVADIFGRDQADVAKAVLNARGFRAPRKQPADVASR